MTEHRVDVAIVGAGPAGLYGATYAGFRGLSVAVIDALTEPGGQVTALYPEKEIHDIAGFPTVTGRELVRRCVAQASVHEPTFLLGEVVEGFTRHDDDTFTLTTDQGTRIDCRAVLIASGLGRFTPRRLPVGDEYEGRGLIYLVRDHEELRDEDLLVIGGGDAAVDWALTFEPIARSVTLIHRRGEFRAHEGPLERLMASGVEVLTHTEVATLEGQDHLEAVEVVDNRTEERRRLPVTRILAALGFLADLGPIAHWPIRLEGRTIPVSRRMETDVPGVFAAGDVTTYDGKLKLVSVSFGEAVIAANHIAAHLDPTVRPFPGYRNA